MDPRIKAILNKRKPLKRSLLPKGADGVQAQAGHSSAEATVAVASGDGGARPKQQKAVDKKKKQQEFESLKVKLQEKLELAAASAAAAAAKREQQALQAAANLSGAADGEKKNKGGKGTNKNKPTKKKQQNKDYRVIQITENKNKKDDDKKDKKAEDEKQHKKLKEELERAPRQVLENSRSGLLPPSEGDEEELFGAPSPKQPSGRQDSEVKNSPKPSKGAVAKVIPEETVDRHPANPMAYTSELHYIDSKTGKLIPTKMAKMGYEDRRRIYADFLVPKLMLIHPALYDEIMSKMYLMPDNQIVQMIYSDDLLGRFASACIEQLHKINYKLKKRNGAADCKKKKK